MANRGRPRRYNADPTPESVTVDEEATPESDPEPEVEFVPERVSDDVPEPGPAVDTWLLTVCSTVFPHNISEEIEGDESDCLARVAELFRQGVEVPLANHKCFNGPSVIQQVRYRKK